MPKKKSDRFSVETARAVLEALHCPDVRRAEGTDEWRESQGSFRLSPDLVAGPLLGAGSAADFYIDVFEPSGDAYVKPKAGNPKAATILHRAVLERGSFNVRDFGDNHEHFYGPMNKKLIKYAGSRDCSPMLGLVMYFKMTGDQYVGPVVAGLDAVIALDRAFGITHHLGEAAMDQVLRGVISPGEKSFVLSLPIEQPLAFVLYVADKRDGVRVLLLVNHATTSAQHPFATHSVIQWLRDLATPAARPAAQG